MKALSNLPKRTLKKIEVAEAQLKLAVRLFFSEYDPIPIETLVGAASGVLTALAKHYGLQAFLHDSDWIRPEYKGEWIRALHKEQNFFKHADKDPNETLDYSPEALRFRLLEACHLYRYLASDRYLKHRQCVEAVVYEIWFGLAYPYLLNPPTEWHPLYRNLYEKFAIQELDSTDFSFFREAIDNAS